MIEEVVGFIADVLFAAAPAPTRRDVREARARDTGRFLCALRVREGAVDGLFERWQVLPIEIGHGSITVQEHWNPVGSIRRLPTPRRLRDRPPMRRGAQVFEIASAGARLEIAIPAIDVDRALDRIGLRVTEPITQ